MSDFRWRTLILLMKCSISSHENVVVLCCYLCFASDNDKTKQHVKWKCRGKEIVRLINAVPTFSPPSYVLAA